MGRVVRWGVALGLLAVAGPAHAACDPPAAPGYAARMQAVLASGRDVLGERLLARPGGPTYAGARGQLAPLLLARSAKGRKLTDSGVHYVPFGQGGSGVALHVADGSQILWRRADGPKLTVRVGGERFGSCLARLSTPRLADGWLPILETSYRDARGVRYRQESFAARAPRLASYVRIEADRPAPVRLSTRTGSLAGAGYARWDGRGRPVRIDASTYEAARARLVSYWQRRLAAGAAIDVPERRVVDARRALLVQNLLLGPRYSVGNAYEQYSFPETLDVAQTMAEQGFPREAAGAVVGSLPRRPEPYASWKRGEKLLGAAVVYRLSRDRAFLARVTPALRGYLAALERQERGGLLPRERYSSDIPDQVVGFHTNAVVRQGLVEIAAAWAQAGQPALARRARALAARLDRGIRRAVAASQQRLPDGSLFLTVRLGDRETPYRHATESRPGSYWNLVAPYALASGLFARASPQTRGALRYLRLHGTRLLGMVRAGAYALYGRDARFPTGGTDQVYGINASRFLALADAPDQLVLSLYGQLAAGMAEGTYVAGEAASVTPLPGTRYRAMYLPPNSAANAAYLETLRLLLVHDDDRALELAYATPRAWLAPGKRIAVERLPTRFGAVSYTLEASASGVHATLELPAAPRTSLRLRLPGGKRIRSVAVDGRASSRFDPQTVDLTGRRGSVELDVAVG